jgi:hypothetical protein
VSVMCAPACKSAYGTATKINEWLTEDVPTPTVGGSK